MQIFVVDVDTNNPSADGKAYFSTRDLAQAYVDKRKASDMKDSPELARYCRYYISEVTVDSGCIDC